MRRLSAYAMEPDVCADGRERGKIQMMGPEDKDKNEETGKESIQDEKRLVRARRLALKAAGDWGAESVGTYASSIAFFFFISIIPLLIFLLQLLPLTGVNEYQLYSFLIQLIPETARGLVSTVITEAYRRSFGIMSVSALFLAWAASRGTMALRLGLNHVYEVKERRPYPLLCLISIGYTVALLVIFSVILFLIFAGPLTHYLTMEMPELFHNPVTIKMRQKIYLNILMTILFALVYTFIPAGSRKFFRQLPGAFAVTVLWEVFSNLFAIYVRGYNTYTMFYGSLGAIAITLFWLYCLFYILLTGAYCNRFLGNRWERIKAVVFRKKTDA